MPTKPERRFRFTFRGKFLSGFVWIDIGEELVVKPLVAGVRKHLSFFSSGGKLHRHVTHEEYEPGLKRRHTQRDTIPPEKLLDPVLRALAPADDPPPRISSLKDENQMAVLTNWFGRIWPRLFRKATSAPVYVIKGPLGEFLERAFAAPLPQDFNIDFEPLARYHASAESEKDAYETIRETDLRIDGRRIAFSEDWSSLIFLVTEDEVLELNVTRLEAAVDENLRTLGFEGYLRSLKRSGYPLFDQATVRDLREELRLEP